MKKVLIIIGIVLILSLCIILKKDNLKMYSRDLFYMDTIINVKIYCSDTDKANDILDGVDNIYHEYHNLTDRYNSYEGVNNVYYINHNDSKETEITLDSKLYDLISYALDFSKSTDLFDINLGGVIDVWKRYRDKGTGIPTMDELNNANKKNKIKLLGDNKIKNNHPNIDLGGVSKGYTTKIVGAYLEENNIEYYLINAGGNVLAGKSYDKDYYKIGIKSPSDNSVIGVVKGVNISVVTSGGYERNYVYNGTLYHHIISPKTLYPTNYMKSVTIVSTDSALADMLSTTLFLMDIDDGLEFIKNYDAEAIWVDNDDNLIKSEGFSKYE